MEIIQNLDRSILFAATQVGGESLQRDQIIYIFAAVLPFVLVLGGIWIFLTGRTKAERRRNQEIIVIALVAVLLGIFANFILQQALHRPRPFITYPDLHHLDLPVPLVSFPSGHAFLSFVFAGTIFFIGYHRRMGAFLLGVAAVITIGRVLAGVHYPSDVVAGAVFGLLLAKLISWQSRWVDEDLA